MPSREVQMDREEQSWKTVKETAALLQIPLSRCYELIHAGELPAVRVGERSIRVPAQELEQVLLEQRRIVQR
jgi:excisionase family DNA binding protein